MPKRVCLVVAVYGFLGCILLAREYSEEPLTLATVDTNGGVVSTWRYEESQNAYTPLQQPSYLFVDKRTYETDKNFNSPLQPQQNPPVIADFDGDGANELLVADAFGISILGQRPAYYSFADTMLVHPLMGSNAIRLLVSDFDGDGGNEIMTQRWTPVLRPEKRKIEIWKPLNGKLTSLWSKELDGIGWTLLLADVDGDQKQELITASDTICILKERSPLNWDTVAELPNIASLIDVVRVADVDNDGRNEILATGNSGKLTIYKHRKGEFYPVMWQSELLMDKNLNPTKTGSLSSYTQGLDVADINGDQKQEILVGTVESGDRTDPDRRGHIHVFAYNGSGKPGSSDDRDDGFHEMWVSDWTFGSPIPAFSSGDLDGNGLKEFVYCGREIYGYSAKSGKIELKATLPIRGTSKLQSAIGILPLYKEPAEAIRIIPLNWTLPQSTLHPGETATVSFTLRNVWAPAKDVMVEISNPNPNLIVKNSLLRIGDIARDAVVTTPSFTVEAPRPTTSAQSQKANSSNTTWTELTGTITAAGEYRQVIHIAVVIR